MSNKEFKASSNTAESARIQTAGFQTSRVESVQRRTMSVRRVLGLQPLNFNYSRRSKYVCTYSRNIENERIGLI